MPDSKETLSMLPSPVRCMSCLYRAQRPFCNLTLKPLLDFDRIGELVIMPTGSVLIREGDRCTCIFVICTGRVLLSCNSLEGKTLNTKIALPGDVLGLGAAISGGTQRRQRRYGSQPARRWLNELTLLHFWSGMERQACMLRACLRMNTNHPYR